MVFCVEGNAAVSLELLPRESAAVVPSSVRKGMNADNYFNSTLQSFSPPIAELDSVQIGVTFE